MLIANRNILYRGIMYKPGDTLPANDLEMVKMWKESESVQDTESESVQDTKPEETSKKQGKEKAKSEKVESETTSSEPEPEEGAQ